VVANEENGPYTGWWINLLMNSFDLFRWPALYFYNWDEGPDFLFWAGFLITILWDALIVERLVFIARYFTARLQ
jgi:hypothetical protein